MKRSSIWIGVRAFLILSCILIFAYHFSTRKTLEVEGIILGDHSVALVNGKVLKVGDKIEGAEVVDIGENFVKFSSALGGYDILRLRKHSREDDPVNQPQQHRPANANISLR